MVFSEEEAKKKIYNVSCERYFGFGCELDEETSNKLEGITDPFQRIILLLFYCCLMCFVLFLSEQEFLEFCLSFLIHMLMLSTRTMVVRI